MTSGSGAAIDESTEIQRTSGRAASSRMTRGVAVTATAFTIHSGVTDRTSVEACRPSARRTPA